MTSGLAAFQHAFARAVWAADAGAGDCAAETVPVRAADAGADDCAADAGPRRSKADADAFAWAAQPAFAVYRNTALRACVDALAANYPAVLRLVGDAWFRVVAADYARAHPPHDERLLLYGEQFPGFVHAAAGAHELPYLGEVAQLDRSWSEAHVAADAPVLHAQALAAILEKAPDSLARLVLVPHPAARWRWCAHAPAFTIWSRNRAPQAFDETPHWQAEGALLTRPGGAVQWQAASLAACTLLDRCADGVVLPEALRAALVAQPRTEPEADLRAAQVAEPEAKPGAELRAAQVAAQVAAPVDGPVGAQVAAQVAAQVDAQVDAQAADPAADPATGPAADLGAVLVALLDAGAFTAASFEEGGA